jgi:hypothetical protein
VRKLPILLCTFALLAAGRPASADEPPAAPPPAAPAPEAPPAPVADAPAAAPAPAATTTTATTTSTSAPTTVASVSAEVKKDIPPRFYGFAFDLSFWDGSNLNAVNYSNIFAFLFEPVWNFGKVAFKDTRFASMALAGRLVMEIPFFTYDEAYIDPTSDNGLPQPCSNVTTSTNGGLVDPTAFQRCGTYRKYRAHFGDALLTLKNPKIVEIPYAKINVNPSITFSLPTSLESQFANLYLGVGAGLGVTRSFFDGKLTVGYSFGATKFFHQYNVPVYRTNPIGDGAITNNYDTQTGFSQGYIGDPTYLGNSASFNSDYGFRHTFLADLAPTDKIGVTALYILIDTFKNAPEHCDITYNGQSYNICDSTNAVAGVPVQFHGHPIPSQVIWITAGYQALDWLNVNIAYITWSPTRFPDNSPRQPFFSADYNGFSSVSLGATISIDKAAAKIF